MSACLCRICLFSQYQLEEPMVEDVEESMDEGGDKDSEDVEALE